MSDSRQALQDKIDGRIEQAEARLDLLRAKAKQAGADSRLKINEEIEDIEEQKSALESKLQELKDASGDAWRDLQTGIEAAWRSLSSALDRAGSRFS